MDWYPVEAMEDGVPVDQAMKGELDAADFLDEGVVEAVPLTHH
jgi:hypothetical protein